MIIRLAAFAMGTRFELVLAGDDEVSLRSAGEAAIGEIEEWDQRLSLFRADSLVSHVNRTAHERPVRLDRDTFDLLALARDVWERSGGAFDITMGAAMRRLGFHPGEPGDSPSAWGMDAVVLNPADLTVSFSRLGIALDLGALGKGHAIDCAIAALRERGVTTALVHGGTSSVGAIGAPHDQPDGWRIALGPDSSQAPVILLRDQCMSVSGQHGRTVDGKGHILDPRTGQPAEGAAIACVVGDSARIAEAWSTALLVLNRRPDTMPPGLASFLYSAEEAAKWQSGRSGLSVPPPSRSLRSEGRGETTDDTKAPDPRAPNPDLAPETPQGRDT